RVRTPNRRSKALRAPPRTPAEGKPPAPLNLKMGGVQRVQTLWRRCGGSASAKCFQGSAPNPGREQAPCTPQFKNAGSPEGANPLAEVRRRSRCDTKNPSRYREVFLFDGYSISLAAASSSAALSACPFSR